MGYLPNVRCLLLFPTLLAAPGLAQEVPVAPAVGADSPEAVVARDGGGNCFVFRDYVVTTRMPAQTPGEVILVDRRAPGSEPEGACASTAAGEVLRLPAGDEARFFFGLDAPYLLVDAGTGPEYRQLTVYDLQSGEAIHRDRYFAGRSVRIREDHGLEYFVPLEEAGGHPCPRAADWDGHGFEERVVVDLASGELERTGEVRCSYRM